MADEPKHIDTEDVRAGETPHIVRYVLAVSLVAVIIAFTVILIL
ncbi:hypothetical protein [Rhizorhapis sp. SPR117]